jgi:protein phosphatase
MKLSDALQIVTRTDPGLLRSHNEDAVFGNGDLGIAILADGMGGYNAGEVASGMATTLLSTHFSQLLSRRFAQPLVAGNPRQVQKILGEQITATNAAIYHSAQSQAQFAGMGTTLVLGWFYDNTLSVAHVGDSRLYRLRGESFEQITHDHSLLQEQLDNGLISPEDARHSVNKNLVTRALGVESAVDPEFNEYDVAVGDLFLLCSDGLNDMLDDAEIASTLQSCASNIHLAADQLVQLANDKGGHDNVSVILIKVLGDFSARGSWWHKLLAWLK